MNISIAVADHNTEYLKRLAEVLQEHEDLSVSIFTSFEKLEGALEQKRFDIVLFDPDMSEQKLNLYRTKLGICLYSEEAENMAMYSECEKVIKYQRVSRIYQEMIKVYADKAGYAADFDHSQNTEILAVYSPIGGSGKTTIAWSAALKYAAQGEMVLFLSMEQLDSSFGMAEHTSDGEGITVLLETLSKKEKTNFELKLKGIVKKSMNGVFYLEGFEKIVDYNTVSKEEMTDVIEKIRKNGTFHKIIIDMNVTLDAVNQAALEQADKLIVIERPGDAEQRKLNLFAKQALVREYAEKIYLFMNFSNDGGCIETILNRPCIGHVPNYGNQTFKNLVQMIASRLSLSFQSEKKRIL